MTEINPVALEAARKAVEDALVDMRDSRMWMWPASGPTGNGFSIREYDGSDSSVIRFSTRHGLTIALKAYFETLDSQLSSDAPRLRSDGTDGSWAGD
jgi:hypothetical protein